MIIDLILDRRDYEREHPGVTYADYVQFINSDYGKGYLELAKRKGYVVPKPYSHRDFYWNVSRYIGDCGGSYAHRITGAMDYGTEEDVKRELCLYVMRNEYSMDIVSYIMSVTWIDFMDEMS